MSFAWWHLLLVWLPMLPTFWSIWDIWNHAFASPRRKAGWLIFVVLLPVIGGLVYIFRGRSEARKAV